MLDFFQQRITRFTQAHDKHRTMSHRLSLLRGVAFLASAVLCIVYFSTSNLVYLVAALGAFLLFYLLITRHRKEEYLSNYHQILVQLNQDEKNRLEGNFKDFETGSAYDDPNHPYSGDLDLFGQHSLYQLINRCQMQDSRDQLASWLTTKGEIAEINARQEAIRELSKDADFLHKFQATTKIEVEKKKKNDPHITQSDLIHWAGKPLQFSQSVIWRSITWILVGVLVLISGFYLLGGLSYHVFYISLILNGLFLGLSIKHLNDLSAGIDKSYFLISTYQQAISLIVSTTFESKKLRDIQQTLTTNNALGAISKLAALTHRLNSRANLLYGLLDIFFLLDAFLLLALYKWKSTHQKSIHAWFEAVNDMECLLSVGGYTLAQPDYCFPEIIPGNFHFEAVALGHPLIPESQVVRNDYLISGKGNVDIITGSNMSGKSTFQRTVGVSMVLAQMGAPVMATSMKMSPTHLFTSMRTKDNLAENTSSFYAELKRIQELLTLTNQHSSTFFLLDEILKGTNSEDRHLGAIALTKKLTTKNAFGLISTHDLTLGMLEQSEKHIRNFSFNSTIKGDQILFDYRLTPGVCKSFNASKLMEKMGIM